MSHQFLLTLKSLYAANGFLAVALYLPQIVRAWKDKQQAHSLSMVTFGGWALGSFITALYAWYFVRDPLFTAISIGNTAGSGTIFLLIVRSRVDTLSTVPRFLSPFLPAGWSALRASLSFPLKGKGPVSSDFQ